MSNFWINLYKFPRFLISVLIGFFLTTFKPVFKLLNNKRIMIIFLITLTFIVIVFYKILRKMTGVE
uniref:Uncharacterized protein ycf33 n=1 Tax=Polysiphonia sertularioides TaxID=945028 RepID=A0A1Z1MH16_9FLOR|nr:hypothetical protein [Polysiphonia sertularioides]